MDVPLEISFRGIENTQLLEDEIRETAAKLERLCNHIISCKVAVEQVQKHHQQGNPYHVRIDVMIPENHEIVIHKEPNRQDPHPSLITLIHEAFGAVRTQIEEVVQRQKGKIKQHPQQEINAFVSKIFKDKGYGFLKRQDGTEVYFHKNSVLHNKFDRIKVGAGVHYVEEMGIKGPQASTVRIVDIPSL